MVTAEARWPQRSARLTNASRIRVSQRVATSTAFSLTQALCSLRCSSASLQLTETRAHLPQTSTTPLFPSTPCPRAAQDILLPAGARPLSPLWLVPVGPRRARTVVKTADPRGLHTPLLLAPQAVVPGAVGVPRGRQGAGCRVGQGGLCQVSSPSRPPCGVGEGRVKSQFEGEFSKQSCHHTVWTATPSSGPQRFGGVTV